jgi:hypothetical protein
MTQLHEFTPSSIENLLFIEHVIEFQKLTIPKLLQEEAARIFDEFLRKDSMYEININKDAVEHVDKTIHDGNTDITLFDYIKRQIEFLIADPVMRFLDSDEYVQSLHHDTSDDHQSTPRKTPRLSLVDFVGSFFPKTDGRSSFDGHGNQGEARPSVGNLLESPKPPRDTRPSLSNILEHNVIIQEARRSLQSGFTKVKSLLYKPKSSTTNNDENSASDLSPTPQLRGDRPLSSPYLPKRGTDGSKEHSEDGVPQDIHRGSSLQIPMHHHDSFSWTSTDTETNSVTTPDHDVKVAEAHEILTRRGARRWDPMTIEIPDGLNAFSFTSDTPRDETPRDDQEISVQSPTGTPHCDDKKESQKLSLENVSIQSRIVSRRGGSRVPSTIDENINESLESFKF